MNINKIVAAALFACTMLLVNGCSDDGLPNAKEFELKNPTVTSEAAEPKDCREACQDCLVNCKCDETNPAAAMCADGADAYAQKCSPIVLAPRDSKVLGGPGGMSWRFTNIGQGRVEIRQFMGQYFDERVDSSAGVFETSIGQLTVKEGAGHNNDEVHLFAC